MQLSPRLFRFLLILYLLLFGVAASVDHFFPQLVPAALAKAQQQAVTARFAGISAPALVMLSVAAVLSTVLLGASLVGLYVFRPWARVTGLIQMAAGLAVLPLFGAISSSGWASMATHLLSMIWALILALAWFSPLRARFKRAGTAPPVPIVEESNPEAETAQPVWLSSVPPDVAAPAGLQTAARTGAPAPISATAANLIAALRSLLFMRAGRHGLHATWSQLMLFMTAAVVLHFVADFARVGAGGQFSWYGLPGVLFTLPVVLLAAWCMAQLANRPGQTLLLAVLFSAMQLWLDLFYAAASAMSHTGLLLDIYRPRGYPYYAVLAWSALASAVAAIRLLGMPARQRVFAALIALIVIGGAYAKVYRDQILWMVPYNKEAAAARWQPANEPQDEDVFYLQPKLLERELAAVKPSRKGGINLYFIGAAGYGDQDVFMKEVRYVDAMFKQRFDTEGHSVLLINNPQTARQFPIASATSLGLALKRVGAAMNKDKDILFLYLTSHGSQNHHLSLTFGEMQFNTLDPKRLRALLDESGIKRRVIVISACYSGGFVEPLKTDNSLIITASAADRNSFGCSNEADFTYFGKAYFDEALKKTDSFTEAFALAKPVIAAREKKDDFLSSNPQMFAGKNIGEALAEFARNRNKPASK